MMLLVGSGGMLGRAFDRALALRGGAFRALTSAAIDLRDDASVAAAFTSPPRVVINCAAYTNVDAAESHESEANAVNGDGVGRLARECAAVNATLVHFSTDYVFAGNASAPYQVSAAVAPHTAYGRSKALGESLLRSSGVRHLLIRTSWLYAPWGKNFVRTIAAASEQRDELRVVDDQRGRPTSAESLVQTTLALLDHGAEGTFHAADDGECTWFDLAAFIVKTRKARARVLPCTTDEYPRPAPRPRYSVLDLSGTHALVGAAPHWHTSVRDTLTRLEDE